MAKKILVADDERHIVRLVQVNLEQEGYDVVVAYDGKEAVDKAESERPDLITDVTQASNSITERRDKSPR